MTLLLHELQQMQQKKKKKKKSSFKQEAHHRTFPSKTFLTQTPERDGSAPVALPSSTTGAWAMGSRGHELPELACTLGNPKPKTSFSLGIFFAQKHARLPAPSSSPKHRFPPVVPAPQQPGPRAPSFSAGSRHCSTSFCAATALLHHY